jgi:hypothetical protein
MRFSSVRGPVHDFIGILVEFESLAAKTEMAMKNGRSGFMQNGRVASEGVGRGMIWKYMRQQWASKAGWHRTWKTV